MDFLLLGPVGLRVDGHAHRVASDMRRRLVAALALRAGRPVTRDELIECLWDDAPATARESLYTYVSRMRTQLRETALAARTAAPVPEIASGSHTYVLRADPDTVDVHRFRRLRDRAQSAAARGDDAAALALFAEAGALWRGEALAGLAGLWAARTRAALEEERVAVAAEAGAASLRRGRFAPLVADLLPLLDRHPTDETLAACLLLAYHGSGRHTDALRLFQRINKQLRDEQGARPGTLLSRLHEGILADRPAADLVREALGASGERAPRRQGAGQDSGADARRPGGAQAQDPADDTRAAPEVPATNGHFAPAEQAAPEVPALPVPRMLPRVTTLVGRADEMRRLEELVGPAVDDGVSLVSIGTVSAMAGAGKTTLAVSFADRCSAHFTAGCLFLNLRGHSATQEPMGAHDALVFLLRSLGVPPDTVPGDVDGAAALWRSVVADRRTVIVLDDAADTAQVLPLLPGTSNSLVIITSRRQLDGLPDALTLLLEALPPDDAVVMFRNIAGAARTRDTALVTRIVGLCGHLPLAIELAATRFRHRAAWTLNTLHGRLARVPGRLDLLRTQGGEFGVARAFSLSYRTLTRPGRRAFRLLSMHPGTALSADSAAALLGVPLPEAEDLLEELLSSSLMQEQEEERYTYHDLLHEYARSLTVEKDDEAERAAAMARLTVFYVGAAQAADALAHPHRLEPAVPYEPVPDRLPFPATPEGAAAWLAAEREALLGVEERAREHGAPELAAVLGQFLVTFLDEQCHWGDGLRVATASAGHWRAVGHRRALCRSLLALSAAHAQFGDYGLALDTLDEALALARESSDTAAEAESLETRGTLQWYAGAHHEALTSFETALAFLRSVGDDRGTLRVRGNMGVCHLHLGDYSQAKAEFHVVGARLRAIGDHTRLGRLLVNEGNLHMRTRRPDLARRNFEEAIELIGPAGNHHDLAIAYANLAESCVESGDAATALSLYRTSMPVLQALSDRRGQADALNGIGRSHTRLGQYEDALSCHAAALDIAQGIGAAREEEMAHRGIGESKLAMGEAESAVDHLRRAVDVAERMGDPYESAIAREALARALAAVETQQ
ncbi:tetratricopeptide repeat protein [Streptomyces sp. NPDC050560]|uniref:AfsR/SARP family transcriptional regulator n=1 Tax=Streptomyces sp. NPDC050560 TaxID=3365630 RepID=UPI0037B7D65D